MARGNKRQSYGINWKMMTLKVSKKLDYFYSDAYNYNRVRVEKMGREGIYQYLLPYGIRKSGG